MNIYKNPLFYLSLILAVIVGFQTWSLVQAGTFAEPTSAFPTSDVSAPVETGAVPQTKFGKLSFASTTDSTNIKVSVGLSGLCLKENIYSVGPPDCATTWGAAKGFVEVWSGPDADGIISYKGGVEIQMEGGLLNMEVDSDGNVDIAGSLTTGSPSEMLMGREGDKLGYLCDGYPLYGEKNMYCCSFISGGAKVSDYWEKDINECVKNMRLYVTDREAGDWPLGFVGSNYEDQTSGSPTYVYNNKKNTITVTVWRDSSKDNTAIGCKFVTKIKIDGYDGSAARGWITGYLRADEILEFTKTIFGN